jgi:hypothetical protein
MGVRGFGVGRAGDATLGAYLEQTDISRNALAGALINNGSTAGLPVDSDYQGRLSLKSVTATENGSYGVMATGFEEIELSSSSFEKTQETLLELQPNDVGLQTGDGAHLASNRIVRIDDSVFSENARHGCYVAKAEEMWWNTNNTLDETNDADADRLEQGEEGPAIYETSKCDPATDRCVQDGSLLSNTDKKDSPVGIARSY